MARTLGLAALWTCWAADASASPERYPTAPYPLGDTPTALARPDDFQGFSEWGERIWVGTRGRVVELKAARNGSLRRTATMELPPDAIPTAMADIGGSHAFLDGANERLLFYAAGDQRTTAPDILPVGPEPSGLITRFDPLFLLVANAGSGDLSTYTAKLAGGWGREHRIPVGGRPEALLNLGTYGSFVLTNSATGTVQEYDTYSLRRVGEVKIGGAPSAVAQLSMDLAGGEIDHVIVADAATGIATTVRRGYRRPLRRGGTTATGLIQDLAVGYLDRDRYPDLAVADRDDGRVLVLHGRPKLGFSAPTIVARGVDPVAIATGKFGGDYQHDLLVADARSRSVRMILTPGDRKLSPSGRAANVVTDGHRRVFWSQPRPHRRHRLVVWQDGAVSPLSVPLSRQPFNARRARIHGHSALTYERCRKDRCRPFVFDVVRRREIRVRVPHPARCEVKDVAVWERTTAYVIGGRGCPHRARGLWLSGPDSARRVSANAQIGGIAGSGLTYRDGSPSTARARITTVNGSTRDLGPEPGPGTANVWVGPVIDGRFAYWVGSGPQVMRARLGSDFLCHEAGSVVIPGDAGDAPSPPPNFAVDHHRIYYADLFGVFRIDPDRVRWTRTCRR